MLRRLCVTALGLATLAVVAALNASEPLQTKGTQADKKNEQKDIKDLAVKEKVLQERYAKFEADLQTLHDRWAKGTEAERKNAARLKLALDKSVDATITERFSKYVRFLATQKLKDTEIQKLVDQSNTLARDLTEVLALLKGMRDPLTNRKEERMTLEDQIKKLEQLIKVQKIINGQIEIGLDKKDIKSNQADVTQATKDFAKKLAAADKKDKGDKKNGEGGEAKNDKSEAKEGKGDGDKGKSKDAGKEDKNKEAKPGDAKNAGDKKPGDKQGLAKEGGKESKAGKESKPGESKSGKGSESKAGDSKSGKGSESKAGDKKESQGDKKGKEGDAKDGGDKKEGEKQGSLKTKEDEKKAGNDSPKKEGDKKEGSAKSGGDKQGDKQGQPKNADPKSGDKSESKSGSPSKSSQGESKPGKSSSGQGQPKSGGEPKDDPASSKKDSSKNDDNAQNKQSPKRNVDDAVQNQKDLEKNIDKNVPKAIKDGEKAVDNLELAKKKLEELLRQLREEEQAQLLATLIQRCKEMLRMQEEVLKGTEAVARAIDANNDKKPSRTNIQDSLNLSDDEKKIVVEATKAIELLEAEGSAVAFPEVFQQVREDMKHIARRLAATPVDPGKVTQAIEQDVIDTLKEMIKALEKAKEKLDQKPPPPPSNGQPPPQPDPKLLNKIQELKMVRAMQLRVNNRTQLYAKEYKGEQADDAAIRRELRNLSDRQDRIFEVTRNIAKGD